MTDHTTPLAGGTVTRYVTTLQAPLTDNESRAIDAALADLKHFVATLDAAREPDAILRLSLDCINKAFTLRATIEAAYAAANRRAFQPPAKPFRRGVNPSSPKPDTGSKVALLRELGLAEAKDALKELGLE